MFFFSINTRAPNLGAAATGTSFDLSAPIYQCASLHESRAKNLCRKQPLRMLEHTQGKVFFKKPLSNCKHLAAL